METPTLHYVESLARRAGEILKAGFGRRHHLAYKGEIDIVTEMDQRSEAYLLGEIRRSFPDHAIVSEESGQTTGKGNGQWIIDPLDGTINYAHGVPIFSVSLAYSDKGKLQLGVVYDPMRDECFSAERGCGAWLNGQPIQASLIKDLNNSLLVTGFPYDIRTNADNNLDHFTRLNLLTQGVRRLGSAALDLCYVAAGRFDAFWEMRLNPWDVAAGGLIAQEAAAVVTNMHGGEDYLSPPQSILAANRYLHPILLTLLNEPKG